MNPSVSRVAYRPSSLMASLHYVMVNILERVVVRCCATETPPILLARVASETAHQTGFCECRPGHSRATHYWFVANEVPRVITSFKEIVVSAESILGALFEWLLRMGADTFESMLYAFIWPVFVLQMLGGWGIVALVVAFVGFEKLLRPLVESAVPELRRPQGKEGTKGKESKE